MGSEVYANGNAISCKASDGKVVAGFPDVCLTPPPPPAGPIPVPYPNTAFAKDMKQGSKKVKINGKEVMLKDKSFYKTSPLGNEAATKGQGAGLLTHVITGKTYFAAWSMDVKFEGKNVDRHMDITTSNHASPMANRVVPTPHGDKMCKVEYDNQTCREDVRKGKREKLTNSKAKQRACDRASPPGGGSRMDVYCYRRRCKLKAAKRLLNQRLQIEETCFNDRSLDTTPDTRRQRRVHDDAIRDTRKAIRNEREEIAANCV